MYEIDAILAAKLKMYWTLYNSRKEYMNFVKTFYIHKRTANEVN